MSRSILVTGAAGNLGKAVLGRFLQEGFQVAAMISERRLGDLSDFSGAKPYPVDLLEEEKVKQIFQKIVEHFGEIEMGILTAGGFAVGGLADTGEVELERLYRLNFLTAYHVARPLFLQMQKQDSGGQIIFIGSPPALSPEAARGVVSYAFSKSLLFRLAEVINEEGNGSGITARVIVPGIIDTPQNREAMPDADRRSWVSATEIADRIYHLATPEGRQQRKSIIKVYGKRRSGD